MRPTGLCPPAPASKCWMPGQRARTIPERLRPAQARIVPAQGFFNPGAASCRADVTSEISGCRASGRTVVLRGSPLLPKISGSRAPRRLHGKNPDAGNDGRRVVGIPAGATVLVLACESSRSRIVASSHGSVRSLNARTKASGHKSLPPEVLSKSRSSRGNEAQTEENMEPANERQR